MDIDFAVSFGIGVFVVWWLFVLLLGVVVSAASESSDSEGK